jgi:hypothetical protein
MLDMSKSVSVQQLAAARLSLKLQLLANFHRNYWPLGLLEVITYMGSTTALVI